MTNLEREIVLAVLVILTAILIGVMFGVDFDAVSGHEHPTSTPVNPPVTITPGGPTSTPGPLPGEFSYLPVVLYGLPAPTSTPGPPPNEGGSLHD